MVVRHSNENEVLAAKVRCLPIRSKVSTDPEQDVHLSVSKYPYPKNIHKFVNLLLQFPELLFLLGVFRPLSLNLLLQYRSRSEPRFLETRRILRWGSACHYFPRNSWSGFEPGVSDRSDRLSCRLIPAPSNSFPHFRTDLLSINFCVGLTRLFASSLTSATAWQEDPL